MPWTERKQQDRAVEATEQHKATIIITLEINLMLDVTRVTDGAAGLARNLWLACSVCRGTASFGCRQGARAQALIAEFI